MNTAAEDRHSEPPFPHRLLAAMVAPDEWDMQCAVAVEAWVRLGGATAAILLSAVGFHQLEVVCCRAVAGKAPQMSRATIEHSFGVLLDQGLTIQVVAETGLIGGLHLQVFPWPDLAATLVVQMADGDDDSAKGGILNSLVPVCRKLLANVTDRAVLLPDSDCLEAMAEYSAGAGHEINNPLASIIGQTQLLLKNEVSTERRQALETVGAQAWRIRDMIGNSMLFARPPLAQKTRVDLVALVQQTLQPLTILAAGSSIQIHLASTSDRIDLVADPAQFANVVAQIVRNSIEAIRATDLDGTIRVTLRNDQPGFIELSVEDNGPGITSVEVQRHLFNPFFSGRSAGRGLGFGLCLAWQIVRMHGGILLCQPSDDGGAGFHVALPAG